MIRVLVCGGRDFSDQDLLADILIGLLGQYKTEDVTFISGHARGTQDMIKRAKGHHIKVIEVKDG